ncbi:MAG: hypothetical protein ACT6Q3_03380 [Sphingopyxis sp.]
MQEAERNKAGPRLLNDRQPREGRDPAFFCFDLFFVPLRLCVKSEKSRAKAQRRKGMKKEKAGSPALRG